MGSSARSKAAKCGIPLEPAFFAKTRFKQASLCQIQGLFKDFIKILLFYTNLTYVILLLKL